MENMMSEISFQAMQFVPRFVGVLVLVSLTWLVAKFASYMVQRTTCTQQEANCEMSSFAKGLSRIAFWSIFVLMSPFILTMSGVSSDGISFAQNFIGQVFINWPIWMVLSLVAAGIWFVVQGIPKLFNQAKGSLDTPRGEVRS
jgi:hypothetical protein